RSTEWMAASRWSWAWLRASPTKSADQYSLRTCRRWQPSYRRGDSSPITWVHHRRDSDSSADSPYLQTDGTLLEPPRATGGRKRRRCRYRSLCRTGRIATRPFEVPEFHPVWTAMRYSADPRTSEILNRVPQPNLRNRAA